MGLVLFILCLTKISMPHVKRKVYSTETKFPVALLYRIYQKIIFGLLLFFVAGCSIPRYPLARNPDRNSHKTGLSYNDPIENFQVLEYKGSREDLTFKFDKSFVRLPPDLLSSHRKFFDSLRVNNQDFSPYNPPGCMYIQNNIFMDESEVTNLEYQEFLFYVKRDSSYNYYKSQIPEFILSVEYEKNASEEERSMHQYFTNPAYRFFPVVGVSHNQAQQYCKWRSNVVTLTMNRKFNNDSKYAIFKFRLPTEREWELVASSGFDVEKYPYGVIDEGIRIKTKINPKHTNLLMGLIRSNQDEGQIKADFRKFNRNKSKILVFNVKGDSPYFLDFKYPFYVFGFPPNSFGVNNMIGGVSEMVVEKGVVKGGSWKNTLDEISIKKRMHNPSLEVGFRCVCEVEIINSN